MTVFLNTFQPLACNKFGRNNAITNNLPFFIDGSCRREPDFQNNYPAITQLCRPNKLVLRLNVGDLVIYLTKKGHYLNQPAHWRFIGILEVINIVQNHTLAAAFYTNRNINLSQNIICNQTAPFPLNMTHGLCGFKRIGLTAQNVITIWNRAYVFRSTNYPLTAITRTWNNNLYLNNPPIITSQMMLNIFGRIPGTQNPPKLSNTEWTNFRIALNI
jgi:hypothetical protein